MTRAAVIVPYRPRTHHDRRNLVRVLDHLRPLGWPVVLADDGLHPFSRAASLNQGGRAVVADVFVLHDADMIVPLGQLAQAVADAATSPGLVVAFSVWEHLDEAMSARVCDGWEGDWTSGVDLRLENQSVGAVGVVSAQTWASTGGMPVGFRGWGMEDVAAEIAWRTLAGPTRRVPGPGWHLSHPVDGNRPAANIERLGGFIAAAGDPAAMSRLLGLAP